MQEHRKRQKLHIPSSHRLPFHPVTQGQVSECEHDGVNEGTLSST